jgi:hypothetical protein
MMPGIYLGLLLPLLIIMALVLIEIGLAKRYGWRRVAANVTDASSKSAAMNA